MSDDFLKRVKHERQEQLSESIVSFNLDDVINNPYAIRKLNEERELLFAETEDLKQKLESSTSELMTLRSKNQELSSKLDEVRERSLPVKFILLLSDVLLAIGVSQVTSDPPSQSLGWGLIVLSVSFKLVTFRLFPK